MTEKVRIKERDQLVLMQLQEHPKVREMAAEQGIVEDESHTLSWEQVFMVVIPDDADPLARPEEEMHWQNAGDAKETILDLAGENVSVHEVVTEFTQQFTDEQDITLDNNA